MVPREIAMCLIVLKNAYYLNVMYLSGFLDSRSEYVLVLDNMRHCLVLVFMSFFVLMEGNIFGFCDACTMYGNATVLYSLSISLCQTNLTLA